MADDNVYITGSEPDWAVQKTLEDILKAVNGSKKATEEQKKEFDKQTSGGKLFDKAAWKQWTVGLKEATEQGVKQGRANEGLVTSTKDLNRNFKESSKLFKTAAVGAGLVGGALGGLYEHFKSTLETFTKLTDSGLAVNMSYRGLSKSLQSVGMSLKQFEDIAGNYATTIGRMGVNEFFEVVNNVGEDFFDFGLTMAEGAEWTAQYLERQRAVGNYSIYTQENLNEAVRSNIERLTAYSKVLNVSRSEIQDAQNEAAADAMVQSRIMSMGAVEGQKMFDALQATVAGLTAMGGRTMASDFTQMMGFDDPSMAQAYRDYADTAASDVLDGLHELHTMASEGIEPSMADIERLGKKALEYATGNASTLAQAVGQMDPAAIAIQELAKMYELWETMSDKEKALRLNEAKQVNAMVKQTSRLSTNVDKLKLAFLYFTNDVLERLIGIFGIDGTESAAEKGIAGLATAAGDAAQFLMDLADGKESWKDVFKNLGSAIWSGVSKGFGALWNSGVEVIREGLNNIVAAIQNWNPLSKASYAAADYVQDSAYGDFATRAARFAQGNPTEAEQQQRMARAQKTHLENSIAKSMSERDAAVAQIAQYNQTGVTGSMYAASGQVGIDALIGPFLETIQIQTRVLNESKRQLEKLNETAEANSG